MPGGSVMALLLWLYRRHKKGAAGAESDPLLGSSYRPTDKTMTGPKVLKLVSEGRSYREN
jgi:hypothetical protein